MTECIIGSVLVQSHVGASDYLAKIIFLCMIEPRFTFQVESGFYRDIQALICRITDHS